jgi:hypothetical protein
LSPLPPGANALKRNLKHQPEAVLLHDRGYAGVGHGVCFSRQRVRSSQPAQARIWRVVLLGVCIPLQPARLLTLWLRAGKSILRLRALFAFRGVMNGAAQRRRRRLLLMDGGRVSSFFQTSFTQSLGAELLTDGGLENWTSATNLTSWSESIAGTSTVNQDGADKHGGSFSARMDIDASNSLALISQTASAAINDWIEITWWAKCSLSNRTGRVDLGTTTNAFTPATSWQQHITLLRAAALNPSLLVFRGSASVSLWFDDLSAKKLTLNALQIGTANAEIVYRFTLPASPVAGQIVSIRYRINGSTPNTDYNTFRLVRNDANSAWTAQLRTAAAGVIATPAGWSDIADVGSPDALRVIANGDKHDLYTGVSGTYTQRNGQITETNQQTSLRVQAVSSTGVTELSLISYPLV